MLAKKHTLKITTKKIELCFKYYFTSRVRV